MHEPHLKKDSASNKRLTQLDCQIGRHTGVFTITRTARGWGCSKCIEQLGLTA